jgi:hypothetical protein
MSILTGRELEFLAGLSTSWKRLYWTELARLLKEGDNRCDARHEVRDKIGAKRTVRKPPRLAMDRLAGERYRPRLVFSSDVPADSAIKG